MSYLQPLTPPPRLIAKCDIRDFAGWDATGSNAQDSVVSQWLTQAMTTGSPAYAPNGTYSMDTGFTLAMTGNLEVVLPRRAKFKGTANITKAMIELKDNVGSGHNYGLTWRGGAFDNALGVFVAASDSNSCISFTRLKRVLIEGLIITGAATYTAASTTTDSGLSAADCLNLTVTNCFISGQGDVGCYFGGNGDPTTSSDDGGEVIISNNHFENCWQAFAYKRSGPRAIFSGNTMRDLYSGVALLEASGSPSGNAQPGRQVTISNNIAKRIETSFARLDGGGSGMTQIHGNKVVDFGFLPDGVTVSAIPQALRVLGALQTHIADNIIGLEDWTQGSDGSLTHTAIYISAYSYTGPSGTVTTSPDYVTYVGNDFVNVHRAVVEDNTTAAVGPSFGSANHYQNVNNRLVATNSNSVIQALDDTQGVRTFFGTTEVNRVSASGTFSTRFRTFQDTVGFTRIRRFSQTLTFGTVAAGSAVTQTVTATGATAANGWAAVNPAASAQAPSGIIFQCRTYADAVDVTATNITGSGIAVPSGTYDVYTFEVA